MALVRLAKLGVFWALASAALLVGLALLQFLESPSPLRVLTYNVLAPCWVAESEYPSDSRPYLDREVRRSRILGLLQSVHPEPDLIAMQETTEVEFRAFQRALASNYVAFQAHHEPHYWSTWHAPGIPWEPNGVALFAHKRRFSDIQFRNVALSDTGNRAVSLEATHRSTQKSIRAFSVHLDADDDAKRKKELASLLHLYPRSQTYGDVILGDFNDETRESGLNLLLRTSHFLDVLGFLELERWTHPFWEGGYQSPSEGVLDHIVVRGLKPAGGRVLDQDLWKRFPIGTEQARHRVTAAIKETGSDHFPVLGELLF